VKWLSESLAALASAIILVLYGIRWERNYTAWIAIVLNVPTVLLTAATTDLPSELRILIVAYLAFGVLTACRSWRKIFFLFGSKTAGAFCFTAWLSEQSLLGWAVWLWGRFPAPLRTTNPLTDIGAEFLLAWFVIAFVTHLIGHRLYGREQEKKRKRF
jgi:hypothetical protein